LARFEALERGETLVHAPVRMDGEWRWSQAWLDDLRSGLDRAIDAANPLDPGAPVPTAEWAKAVVPHLGLELRGAKLYRPGASAPEERSGTPAQPLRQDREAQARQAPQQRPERDLRLEAGERRAETEVRAAAEPEMPRVALGGQDERVWILEPLRVAVGGA